MPTERFTVVPAVYLMLIKDNQILLSLRQNTGYEDGKYSFPAGHVEQDEPLTAALVREIKEEIGITIDAKDLKLCVVAHRKTNRNYVSFFFECKKWQGEVVNNEPAKCGELRWASLDAIPENTIEYIKKAIENYRTGGSYFEIGF